MYVQIEMRIGFIPSWITMTSFQVSQSWVEYDWLRQFLNEKLLFQLIFKIAVSLLRQRNMIPAKIEIVFAFILR